MSEWLYQIRIKVTENISEDLRSKQKKSLSKKLKKIADSYNMSLVCTFEAFKEYCDEAEQNGIEKYGLYYWTKSTIEDPSKKSKHLKSFAFYLGDDQIYEKDLAIEIETHLKEIKDQELLEINFIDSNPANNPQPPQRDIS